MARGRGWGTSMVGMGSTVSMLKQVKMTWGGDAVYVVGTNVKYGVFLETGTSRMPAYRWFAPAINEYKRNPEGFVEKNAPGVGSIASMDDAVRVVALALEAQMKKNLTAGGGGRSPGTHPEHPKVPTGNLRGSVKAVKVR